MNKEVHMIGNAHIDPVWLWRWPEGLQAARAAFHSALDRMKEHHGFVFTSSQAAVYAWLERAEPALFEQIRARVAEGRWVIVGGWWVQPDCNIPSGEGLARQSLYGMRYFTEKFGVAIHTGYCVDSFGHNAMLPQILRLSGMDSYVFMRPSPTEKPDLPGRLFYWESPDGSRVTAFRITGEYATWGDVLAQKISNTKEQLTARLPLLMCFYGVGNHGGGPTKENLEIISQSVSQNAAQPDGPKIIFSDPNEYFKATASLVDLPVVKGELQHHASGCYAAHSGIKADTRRCEHALITAEKLAVTANITAGFSYPASDLTRAWQGVLFNHFHDILGGTSVREAYQDARHLSGQALQVAHETSAFALQNLASTIDLSAPGVPIVIWNPHGWHKVGPVELELHGYKQPLWLEDWEGNPVLCQETAPSAVVRGGRRGVTFIADVPSFGYTTYWLRTTQDQRTAKPGTLQAGINYLGNEYFWLNFDSDTGYVTELAWKSDGWRVNNGPAAVPVVIDDPSDTWSHGVLRFDQEVGKFSAAKLTLVENGPMRATLRVTSSYGCSSLTQDFTVYAGLPYIDVRCIVDWHEHRKVLKLEFPVNVANPRATYEIQFGALERPAHGEEQPALHWFDVTGGFGERDSRGLAVLNDSKYSCDVEQNRMRLTILRSPVYAHHDPKELEPGADYHYVDQGVQEFTYRLAPHIGEWQEARIPQLGHELNVPVSVIVEANHPGQTGVCDSLLDISAPNVLLSAVKRAEDGNGTVIRAYEAYGRPTRCDFKWRNDTCVWKADFRSHEVKSFLISNEAKPRITMIDLVERPIQD